MIYILAENFQVFSIAASNLLASLPTSPFVGASFAWYFHNRYITNMVRIRVDSFVFFLVSRNTKLYETGHRFAEFRSFRETDKNTKKRKKVFRVVSQNIETMFRFLFSYIFVTIFNFVHSLRIS